MAQFKPVLIAFFLAIAIFILTKNPLTGPFKLQMALLSLLLLVIYGFWQAKKDQSATKSPTFIFILTSTVLFLVGATGWFFSPFFFTLYLLTIVLAFVFSPAVSFGFVAALVGLFSFNIGEVDLAYDFLVVLSLLTTIPLSLYLRKEYLRLKEAEKEILVLEKEKRQYQTSVEEVLANKINSFAVNLRQPINDVKLLAYRLKNLKNNAEIEKYRQRIITSSEESLHLLKSFEEEATGKKLLSTPETSSPPKPTDQD